MGNYKKKPVVIQAFKFPEEVVNNQELMNMAKNITLYREPSHLSSVINPSAYFFKEWAEIKTLEGTMILNSGDYLIIGVKGELYPCRSDIFKETYEEVR